MVVTLYGGLGYDADEENKYIIMANDTFIMDNTGKAFDAQTFSNHTMFLDWFQQEAANTWATGLFDMFEQMVEYDGVLLDYNTPTIFCDGGHPLCNNDK